MSRLGTFLACPCLPLFCPTHAAASEAHIPLNVPAWTVLPFVALLLGIAILPMLASHFWHSNARKALVVFLLAVPIVSYLIYASQAGETHAFGLLLHALLEYVDFILLLGALFTVAGGIAVQGQIRATPATNTVFLFVGAVLANLIGTTGASMLLIRPVLRINHARRYHSHIPLFFIFAVSNLGGLLTPLGDPPLFLGFLNGVDFFWTLSLWPVWTVGVGVLLAIFLVWDSVLTRREPTPVLEPGGPLRVRGQINFLLLVGILLAVLVQSDKFTGGWNLTRPWPGLLMLAMALLSLLVTPREVRKLNDFSWDAILEVAVLFAGIFITMIPALELLKHPHPSLRITEPWEYFWLTGALSSVLDNAPTYMTFATFAAGNRTLAELMTQEPLVLQAISAGAVFMGALTYIGNGPNFMVKAIAEGMGYRMPSFFGYLLYSGLILLPIFGLVTVLFFR